MSPLGGTGVPGVPAPGAQVAGQVGVGARRREHRPPLWAAVALRSVPPRGESASVRRGRVVPGWPRSGPRPEVAAGVRGVRAAGAAVARAGAAGPGGAVGVRRRHVPRGVWVHVRGARRRRRRRRRAGAEDALEGDGFAPLPALSIRVIRSLCFPHLRPSHTYTYTHTHTRARTRAHTHTRTKLFFSSAFFLGLYPRLPSPSFLPDSAVPTLSAL